MVDITFLGHSFFKIGFPKCNVLIDPFLENTHKDPNFKTLVTCPNLKKHLKGISLILITHEHFDHFDKKLISETAVKENACVVAHDHLLQELSLPRHLSHNITMDQKVQLRDLSITATPAHHPNSFYPIGFLLEHKGKTVYHAGDTDLMDYFCKIKPDIAILPIGGEYTMDCVDAVRAVKTMKPKYAIPMHYNTFKVIGQDPKEFQSKIEQTVLKTKVVIFKPGQKKKFLL
ncbi:MAG: metal-dependent hydrolase [Candidatus Diapherotrites archaeon]|nr:metal-dependent hydrolase [Candidatus Diapherotrites archaeon]